MSSSYNLHWRLSRFYFFYYFFVGSFVPYWGIYLQSENFSPSSIGILLSLFQISRIIAPNFWGWLADHTGHRVKWIKLTSFLGLIGFIGVFWAKGFFWIFLVMSALSLFTSSTLPLAESLTLAHLATTDGHYSRIRLWGSIGFIVASLFLGYLIDLQGINILLWVLLIAQTIIFFLSNTIPETKEIHHKKNDLSIWKIIKTPTLHTKPTSSKTRFRIASAIATPSPSNRCAPVTSKNASSSDSPSTSGVKSRKMSNTCELTCT